MKLQEDTQNEELSQQTLLKSELLSAQKQRNALNDQLHDLTDELNKIRPENDMNKVLLRKISMENECLTEKMCDLQEDVIQLKN